MSSSLLTAVVTLLLSGLAVQLLAKRLRIPSVVFFLVIGVVLGPVGIGLVTLETFGEGLEIVVGLAVAIIVFDGAFALQFERIRKASTTTLRLVTVGAVLTFLGTALAIRGLQGVSWELALVAGALLVATGPTVITPIFEVVRVREHVSAALESEGIINDVTAAIGAVVIFETLLLHDHGVVATLLSFLWRFGVGIGTGLLAAGIIYLLLRRGVTPSGTPQAARFLSLSAALGAFTAAEAVAAEAGIAAAAVAGITLGNLDLPHREEIEEFGRDVTLIALGFVFISLAALIDIDAVLGLGVGGLLLVGAVMLVIRPAVAWIATVGVERFTRSERLFVAAVGPRGIIPASVATLFAIELELAGNNEAAQILLGAVFVVIFATDFIEAGFARQIGDFLGVTPMRTILVGGGQVGLDLATRMENRGEFVVIIERDEEQTEKASEQGFTVYQGDGTDTDVLRKAGIEEAKAVVATTNDDDDNLLVCQNARAKFDVEDVYARVNDRENMEAFESLSVVSIDSPRAMAQAIDNEVESPELSRWMSDITEGHAVQQTTVTADRMVGRSIRDVNKDIPGGCLIATIQRDSEAWVPEADNVLEHGDRITFIGNAEAVRTATKGFNPHD